jgi:hypothetical protein
MVNQLLLIKQLLADNKGKQLQTVLRDQKTENITLNVSKDGKLGVQPGD